MYYRVNYKWIVPAVGAGVNPAGGERRLEVLVESGVAAPAAIGGAYSDGGSFQHVATAKDTGTHSDKEYGLTHALINDVRDNLAKTAFTGFPDKVVDLSVVDMKLDNLRSLSIGVGALTAADPADTANITVTPTPANASIVGWVAHSSDLTKATIIAGTAPLTQFKVHAVANGTSNITATAEDSYGNTITSNVRVMTTT